MRARAIAARLSLGTLLSCSACSSSYSPPVHADAAHAIATVYVREALDQGFRLEGTFSLPRERFNRGWYAEWFTFTAKPTAAVAFPPSFEAGLIRSPDDEFALQPFVAARPDGKAARFHGLPAVSDSSHRIALESKAGTLSFFVDGAVRYRAPVHAFVAAGALETYLQLGHELSLQDDYAKGSIRDVAFTNGTTPDAEPLDTSLLACSFSSNGVSWKTEATSLVAAGKFDVAVADVGRCSQ